MPVHLSVVPAWSEDSDCEVPAGWVTPGAVIYQVGETVEAAETGPARRDLDSVADPASAPDHRSGTQALALLRSQAARLGVLESWSPVGATGLAGALTAAVLRHGVGARLGLDALMDRDGVDGRSALFARTPDRALACVPPGGVGAFEDLAAGVPFVRIGEVDREIDGLDVDGEYVVSFAALRRASTGGLRGVFTA